MRLEKRPIQGDAVRALKLLLHGVSSYPAGTAIGPACWPHHDLIVTTEGILHLTVKGREVTCTAGDACLIPPEHPFRGTAGEGGATIWVQHFFVGQKPPLIALPRATTRWVGVGQWEWPRTLLRRLSREQKTIGLKSEKTGGFLLALLLEEFKSAASAAKTESGGPEKAIELFIDWIEHHALPLPPLKKMAGFSGWSVNYFRDQFRAVTGQPVGEFLKQRRMGEAARLLVETRQPIKEIALLAGYRDVAAFHRAFLSRYKLTPGRYRQQPVPMV